MQSKWNTTSINTNITSPSSTSKNNFNSALWTLFDTSLNCPTCNAKQINKKYEQHQIAQKDMAEIKQITLIAKNQGETRVGWQRGGVPREDYSHDETYRWMKILNKKRTLNQRMKTLNQIFCLTYDMQMKCETDWTSTKEHWSMSTGWRASTKMTEMNIGTMNPIWWKSFQNESENKNLGFGNLRETFSEQSECKTLEEKAEKMEGNQKCKIIYGGYKPFWETVKTSTNFSIWTIQHNYFK